MSYLGQGQCHPKRHSQVGHEVLDEESRYEVPLVHHVHKDSFVWCDFFRSGCHCRFPSYTHHTETEGSVPSYPPVRPSSLVAGVGTERHPFWSV